MNVAVRLRYSFRLLTDSDSPGALFVTTYIAVPIGCPFDTFVCKLNYVFLCFPLFKFVR